MITIDDGLGVAGKPLHSIQAAHDLKMLSLLLGALHQSLLNATLDRDSLSHDFSVLLFSLSDCLECVCIRLCLKCSGPCLSISNDRCFDEVRFGNYLVELDLSLCIHLVDKSEGLLLGFSNHSLILSSYLLHLLRFGCLFQLCSLSFILSLLESLLLEILKCLVIILDSELIGLLLSFKSVLELEDGLLLQGE